MNKDTIEFFFFILFVAGLFFVFSGSPDLWDKWHDAAMRHADGICKTQQQKE